MSILPLKDAVQAAIYFAKYRGATLAEYCWSTDKLEREITDEDRERTCSQLAAAARILADEVVYLRKELNINNTVILNTVLSDCCQAPAVIAGKPGSTQWYACPECRQPCNVFYQDNNTQPQ